MRAYNQVEKSEIVRAYLEAQKKHKFAKDWVYQELKVINPTTAKKYLDNMNEWNKKDTLANI